MKKIMLVAVLLAVMSAAALAEPPIVPKCQPCETVQWVVVDDHSSQEFCGWEAKWIPEGTRAVLRLADPTTGVVVFFHGDFQAWRIPAEPLK